jgi:hypothetical protein
MCEEMVTSGFFMEKTFARMYREFLDVRGRFRPHLLNTGGYSTPRTDIPPEQAPKQYRGVQREPIQGWVEALRGSGVGEPTDQELEASLFLTELERAGRALDDIIVAWEDAHEVLGKIEPPVEREIIWARRMDASDAPPPGAVLLGYEPSTFYLPTCDSAIAEGFFFTYPGSNDEDGTRLKAYHDKLNRWGLFDSPSDAQQYLKAYLAILPQDWDQHRYRYCTTEVRATASPKSSAEVAEVECHTCTFHVPRQGGVPSTPYRLAPILFSNCAQEGGTTD